MQNGYKVSDVMSQACQVRFSGVLYVLKSAEAKDGKSCNVSMDCSQFRAGQDLKIPMSVICKWLKNPTSLNPRITNVSYLFEFGHLSTQREGLSRMLVTARNACVLCYTVRDTLGIPWTVNPMLKFSKQCTDLRAVNLNFTIEFDNSRRQLYLPFEKRLYLDRCTFFSSGFTC